MDLTAVSRGPTPAPSKTPDTAVASAESLSWVPLPCSITRSISSALSPALRCASLMAQEMVVGSGAVGCAASQFMLTPRTTA